MIRAPLAPERKLADPPLAYEPGHLWVSADDYRWTFPDAGEHVWQIQPCGYLCALLFETDQRRAPIKVRLFAPGKEVPFAETEKPPEYVHSGRLFALWLPQPVPNLNNCWVYTAKIEVSQPCVITGHQLYHPMAFR